MGAPGTTSGKWGVEVHSNGLPSVNMSHDKAWMHFNPSVSSFGHDPKPEMLANAHQIAASGALYDALEASREQVFNLLINLRYSADVAIANVAHIDAALALARGEAS